MSARPTVVITGVAGHLGQSLLPLLSDFSVVGIDVRPPAGTSLLRFESLDLGREPSCRALVELLQQTRAVAVVHLAFVLDQVRMGVLDLQRMWQINVAGTARVLEAIAEVNRSRGGEVAKFVFPSSVSAYGPQFPHLVTEDQPLAAHTLPYGIHKQESDDVVRLRAPSLGHCSTYILRPHIYAGARMQNYMIGVLRGVPGGRGRLAKYLRARGKRLPLLLPKRGHYLNNRFQFVHVDDVARLIAWILRRPERGRELHILNVAGRGEALTLQTAARIAGQKIVRLPSRAFCGWVLYWGWKLGISDIPPQALPYMLGSCVMDTRRLRAFLGSDYDQVIRYSNQAALAESFAPAPDSAVTVPAATSA